MVYQSEEVKEQSCSVVKEIILEAYLNEKTIIVFSGFLWAILVLLLNIFVETPSNREKLYMFYLTLGMLWVYLVMYFALR